LKLNGFLLHLIAECHFSVQLYGVTTEFSALMSSVLDRAFKGEL
jgi:hypothetical protein